MTISRSFIPFTLAWSVAMAATSGAAQKDVARKAEERNPAWDRIWHNEKVDAGIRGVIRAVDSQRMSRHLFYLAKDSQSWIDSPGANDNAIGTASVLEMACVLAKHPSERTIRFLFCNEEHTPWTSVTAAQNAKARGENLVAVFNIDGVGAKTAAETAAGKKTNVTAYTAPEGKRLAELMSAASARYAVGLEQRIVKRPAPGDDDGSFVKAGYPAAVVNIGSWPYGDPNYHAEEDTPERCDVENAALAVRATLAAILTLDQDL
jgi:Zn-dependent M28 family amino/carboxypeptidase